MTIRYAGPGGNDGNSGLTWALRKLTLTGVEDTPVVAGDVVHVGPGVYRETLVNDVSGGNTYVVGTVSVVNGSPTVTGAGTAFLANVAVDYLFQVRLFASGNDGVTNGTLTFTSVAGNFQASMIGRVIQINTRGAYVIGAVAAANSITLIDVNGLGNPAAAAGLSYSVMSGEGPYNIQSVDNDTQLTLDENWNGPTITGLAYITYNPIRYIADVTGENTDGVGGVVRLTGSNNDQTSVRNIVNDIRTRSHRLYRGFLFDMSGTQAVIISTGSYNTLEDCVFNNCNTGAYKFDAGFCWVIRRCVFIENRFHINIFDDVDTDDSGHLIENTLLISARTTTVVHQNVGGVTVKNTLFLGSNFHLFVTLSPTLGQTFVVNNCILTAGLSTSLRAVAVGDITEDYNAFFDNGLDRVNTAVGANSNTFPALMLTPILKKGINYPWWIGKLSEWSQVSAIAGFGETAADVFGISRPVTSSKISWGATQFTDMERETGTVRTGSASMAIRDAGRHQIFVPVTATSTTIKVYVYREANYAGNLPQMIIKQPGVADRITTDVGAAGGWNLLTDTFVPAALPPYVVIELVSRNTNGAADETFFDDLDVS